MVKVPESVLKKIEKEHVDGITSADLLSFFASQDIKFGEATLRKWVQLGLLPRSVRVGQKGKHQGSKGKYPVRVVRQILRIKELMARDLTIEEIQRQFLFVRGDIDALVQTLGRIFRTLDEIVATQPGVRMVGADVARAQAQASELVERLEKIEQRLLGSAKGAEDSDRSEAAAS